MSVLRPLQWASRLEGVTLLVLLFVAMPLKYALGHPEATRIVGTMHGVAFLSLLLASSRAFFEGVVGAKALIRILALAVVPFGFVAAERLFREAGRRGAALVTRG